MRDLQAAGADGHPRIGTIGYVHEMGNWGNRISKFVVLRDHVLVHQRNSHVTVGATRPQLCCGLGRGMREPGGVWGGGTCVGED